MSTLQPRPPYTDAELLALYPPSLQLQLVQVLLRHGERTPVTPRFQNTGLPSFWPYCSAARHLRSAILDPDSATFSSLDWQRHLETFGPNDIPIPATAATVVGPRIEHQLDAICDAGMLTDRGRETTTLLGRRLRHLYVDRLGFISPTLSPTSLDSLYLRSTPIPRALESLQQTLHGLYPPHTRSSDLRPVTIIGRSPADETLFPNESNCRRFAVLARAFAQRAATRWNDSPDMDYLTKKIGKWLDNNNNNEQQPPSVAVDGKPRLSGIMDTINSTAAHGPSTKLPKEFYDAKLKTIAETIAVDEWFAGYRESQEYRTLGIGGLLGDVVARMVSTVEQGTTQAEYHTETKKASSKFPPQVRFALSGCHDTTIAGVLASLGAFPHDAWPPFTSHIAIELFFHKGDSTTTTTTTTSSLSSTSKSTRSSWLPSLFGTSSPSSSTTSITNPGIGRKPSSELSRSEKKRIDGYYVRLRYNDQPVTIPGCQVPGNHLQGDETFCSLAAFKSIVDKFTPTDWREQCRTNIKAPAFPSKPEPAGF